MSSTLEPGTRTAGHTDNSILIDAPIDHVWAMTNALTGKSHFIVHRAWS
jgi:aromatase